MTTGLRDAELYFLMISFNPNSMVIFDPFELAAFIEEIEALPNKLNIQGKGAWGEGPVLDSGKNICFSQFFYLALTTKDVLPILLENIRHLSDVEDVAMDLVAKNNKIEEYYKNKLGMRGQISDLWTGNKNFASAIKTVYGIGQPSSRTLPKGFRLW